MHSQLLINRKGRLYPDRFRISFSGQNRTPSTKSRGKNPFAIWKGDLWCHYTVRPWFNWTALKN